MSYPTYLPIIGEISKVVQYKLEGSSFNKIEKELIQTAAMCIRMIKNLKE